MFKKLISAVVLFTFIISNIAFAIPDISSQNKAELKKQENVDIVANPEKVVVLRDYGLVKSRYIGKSGKLIVHIQDAHCNFEAQSNIVKILEGLYKNYDVSLISVEGADGIIDTTWFKSFPDEEIRKEVATYFMKKGEITGPEFLAITSDYKIKLFGAETRSYYIQNLNAFTSSYPQKEEVEKYLSSIKAVIEKLKNYIYGEDLRLMDSKMRDYESKKLDFKDYVKFLESEAGKIKLNLRSYDNFFKLVSTLIYEKKIDFNVTDKERSALIDELSKKMSKDSLTELVSQSLAFKVGKISSVEYYSYLKALAMKNGVDMMKTYPNLYNYIIYNAVYSKIENEKLFADIKNIENAIKEKLFANDDQRTLEKLSRHIEILLGLVNIKLLNGDFDYYKANKGEFSYETFISFLSKQALRYGLSYDAEPPSEVIAENMPRLEDFYAIAIKRDKALVDNTIAEMSKERQKVSVLVTGGFHSEGIAKLLEREGVSYLVVCPNITKDVETPYIKILTNQRTPLEDILSDTAQTTQAKQGMLAPILLSRLIGLNPERIRELLLNVDGIDRARLEALVKDIIGREERLKDGWENLGVSGWLAEKLKIAREKEYAQSETIMLNAYRDAMEAALVSAGLDLKRAKKLTADLTGNKTFQNGFSALYARVSGSAAASESPTGNLIGKKINKKGYIVKNIKGVLSADKNTLTLTDVDGEPLANIPVIGSEKIDVAKQIKIIREKVEAAVKSGNLDDAEKRIAEGIIAYLEQKEKDRKIYLLDNNGDGISGFSDGENCFISKFIFTNPIALFHEAGEGYCASDSGAKEYLQQIGISAHTFLRGLGYKARVGTRPIIENPDEAKLRGGLGLQDRIFGKEDNVALSNMLISAKFLVGAKEENWPQEDIDNLKLLGAEDRRDVILRVGSFNAALADALLEKIDEPKETVYKGYVKAVSDALSKKKGWNSENLILLGQVVRMLGNLELTPEQATAVIRQIRELYNNDRGRKGDEKKPFNYIKESLDGKVAQETMERIESQQELDTFIVQALEAIGERFKEKNAAIRESAASALISIAKDQREFSALYFVREQALFALRLFRDLSAVRALYGDIMKSDKKSAQEKGWIGYVPDEQHFGTSPSYGNVADLRYAAGMSTFWAVSNDFRLMLERGNFYSGESIAEYWHNLGEWKSAVLLEIGRQLDLISKAKKPLSTPAKDRSELSPDMKEWLIDSVSIIGIPAIGLLESLRNIHEGSVATSGIKEKARKAIIDFCAEVDKMIPSDYAWKSAYGLKIKNAKTAAMGESSVTAVNDLMDTTALLFAGTRTDTRDGKNVLVFPADLGKKAEKAELVNLSGGGGATYATTTLEKINYFDLGENVYPTSPMGVDDDGGATKGQKAAAISGELELPLIAFGDMTKSIKLPKPVKDFLGIRIQGDFSNFVNKDGSYKLLKEFAAENKYLETMSSGLAATGVAADKIGALLKEVRAAIDAYDAVFIKTKSASLHKATVQNMVMVGFLLKEGAYCVGTDRSGRHKWFVNPYAMNRALVKYIAVMNFKEMNDIKGYPTPVSMTPNVLFAYLPHGLRKIGQDYFSHTRIREGYKISSVGGLFDQLPTNPLSEEVLAYSKIVFIPPTSFYTSLSPIINNEGIAQMLGQRTNSDRNFLSIWVLPPATDMEETRGMTAEDLMDGVIEKVGRLPNVIFYLDGSNAQPETKKLLEKLKEGIYSSSLALSKDDIERLKKHFAGKENTKDMVLATMEELEAKGRALTDEEVKNTVIIVPMDANRVLFEKAEESRLSGKPVVNIRYNEEETGNIIRDAINGRIQKVLGRNVLADSAKVVADKLHTPLDSKGDKARAAGFLQGGKGESGYTVAEGASVDGSFATGDKEGDQGYYVKGGKDKFLAIIESMRDFFVRRNIRYVIKPGIGGQHTPFQGMAEGFQVIDSSSGLIVGEYELGKNYEETMKEAIKNLGIKWDQIGVIPSSKSGATDETMMVFTEIFYVLLKKIPTMKEYGKMSEDNAKKFADTVLSVLHKINFKEDGKTELSGKIGKDKDGNISDERLFVVREERFKTNSLITLIAREAELTEDQVKDILGRVLGNMFFETTPRPDESRLAAFIKNSGFDKELGDNAPGFGSMFDNVGGRWTSDLHMMTFLAFYGKSASEARANAESYWNARYKGIQQVREGSHLGNKLANRILDEGIKDIALVVPDKLFWMGKSIEQNFNESIWQNGFANLIAVKESNWESQKGYYANNTAKLVINVSEANIPADQFKVETLKSIFNFASIEASKNKQALIVSLADLITTFYGMTSTVGNRLIARALMAKGYTGEGVDISDLNNPATKILQENLYLRQPYVELGKKLLDGKLKELQAEESKSSGAIDRAMKKIQQFAAERRMESNIPKLNLPYRATDVRTLAEAIGKVAKLAKETNRKFVPFIYLEGDKYFALREYLIKLGVEWVLQGTGDQHINYQQVLSNPKRYLPMIISFVPETPLEGRPAIGFAKGQLNNISPNMVRDYFAEASYKALTVERQNEGGMGVFLRMTDSPENTDINILKEAMAQVIEKKVPSLKQDGEKSYPAEGTALSTVTVNDVNVDVANTAKAIGVEERLVHKALVGSIDKSMLLNDLAESVGIKKIEPDRENGAIDNMVKAGIASADIEMLRAENKNNKRDVTGKDYELTDEFIKAENIEAFMDLQRKASANKRLADLAKIRIERAISTSIKIEEFISNLARITGKSEKDIAYILSKNFVFSVFIAKWYLSHPEYITKTADVTQPETLKVEDLVRPGSSEFYGRKGVQVEFSVPEGSEVNEQKLLALKAYQSAVGADMARGEYNYRGTGTKQTIAQFFNDYFLNGIKGKDAQDNTVIYGAWYSKIRSFIEQAFGPNGANLKAIVTNGIGANDQFMWSLIKMYNENKPANAPIWYHAATAREFARLYSEGKIKPDSTVFVDISRSGTTWEGLEVASRSLQEGFNKRIAIVNGGPSKDMAVAAAQQRSISEKTTVEPLVIEMSPDIGGRNMHRKTSIYYTVQTIAGMFLPSMDAKEFARLNDEYDRANDFAGVDESLAVSAGRFLQGSMYLLGAEHITFITNTESLRLAGTEWQQYIMEGSNKKDVISMAIHNLADRENEPPEVLETLANSSAGKKCVVMALLDRSSPTYNEDRQRVDKLAKTMPMMIFTIEGKQILDNAGSVIDVGMTPVQQAAFDILWTDLVTVLTSLLRVDANSNPNVKKVRELTADRVADWVDTNALYAADPIGLGNTELLVSYGYPASPEIGGEGTQEPINTEEKARMLGEKIAKEFAAQIAAQVADQVKKGVPEKLRGRDRLNIFAGNENLESLIKGLRRDSYTSEKGLGKAGWITDAELFPLWSHKGLEGDLANQAEAKTEGPLLGDKSVNIFINTRKLQQGVGIYNQKFVNSVDINGEPKKLVAPKKNNKGVAVSVADANIHETNDAMTMPNIKRMAQVSPTILFESNTASDNVRVLIKEFYKSFNETLAQLSMTEQQSGEKGYPAENTEGLTAEQIYQVSTVPEHDSLQNYLTSSALSDTLDKMTIIIAHDTAIAPGQVAQAGERPINRYLNGKLIDVRGTGKKLLDNIAEAVRGLKGAPYRVVTIAGNATMDEVGQDLTKIGKVLNIQNPDNRYIPIIGLYEVALKIAYGLSSDEILSCLNRIALSPDSKPLTKDDVDMLLKKGVLMILPRIVAVNPSEAAAAYKAAQQALISL